MQKGVLQRSLVKMICENMSTKKLKMVMKLMTLTDFMKTHDGQQTSFARIGTLGPSGTSSEYAASLFSFHYLANQGIRSELLLYDTFEQCMEKLEAGLLDYVIVPHAYGGINDFYMRKNISLIQLFRCDTPLYGLAVRQDFEFHPSMLASEPVVSHPAPINLLKYFLGTSAHIETVTSTSVAARLVAEGVYNIALTNQIAMQQHGLNFACEFKAIPMSWSVFKSI
ncbi:bacilysin biosynthesis protein BacA [Paenibacillus sp. WLX1005]|uniref:bacilysin biosynthesis protein BacA n=1 Tax=Paenibacillus sp. WLX1005 TaxID=3243766 RepID=UPI0039840A60